MSSFNWRKNTEDSIKYGLIMTIGATGIFFSLKAGIPGCRGYRKTYRWNLCRGAGKGLCNLQKMDQRVIQKKIYGPIRAIKLHDG